MPEQLVGGLLDAAQNVIDPFDPSGKRRLPEVPPAKTAAGQVIRGAAQFLIGFIPAVRVLKVVGAAAKLAKGARTLGAGERASRAIGVALEAEIAAVLAGQAVLDPFADRLSNFVEAHPEFRNPITALLAADPNDSEAAARTKLAVEDLAVGLGAAFVPIVKALRAKGVKELSPATKNVTAAEATFSVKERTLIENAKGVISAPEFDKVRQAVNQEESIAVRINGFKIQVEPNLPFSGFPDSAENGFTIGKDASESESEFIKTILHEMHRLSTFGVRTLDFPEDSMQAAITRETKEAAEFANRSFEAFFN